MKNEKGFTLAELLAVITILGILASMAIASTQGILKKSKTSYLDSQNKMMVLAAKTYYAEYRSRLPRTVGSMREVKLQTLIDLKYIDLVKDEKGNPCSAEGLEKSKVVVKKVSDKEYRYTGYLSCNGRESGENA